MKRVLSLLLTIALCLSCASLTVFASEEAAEIVETAEIVELTEAVDLEDAADVAEPVEAEAAEAEEIAEPEAVAEAEEPVEPEAAAETEEAPAEAEEPVEAAEAEEATADGIAAMVFELTSDAHVAQGAEFTVSVKVKSNASPFCAIQITPAVDTTAFEILSATCTSTDATSQFKTSLVGYFEANHTPKVSETVATFTLKAKTTAAAKSYEISAVVKAADYDEHWVDVASTESCSVTVDQAYSVTFNANGGSGAPAAQTKIQDTALTLSATKPTRSGYTFLGWATTSTATTAAYKAGGSYTANANVTLYAVWKSNEGWQQNSTGWWYQNADGSYPKSTWKKISGSWYYFNAGGYRVTGWQTISGYQYYFNANGVMQANCWVGNYYVKSDGKMAVSEWVDGDKYYVDANGKWVEGKTKSTAGWVQDSVGWWYKNADGTYPKSTWKEIDGKQYYFNASGYRVTGWQTIDGYQYYFNANGIMQANCWVGNYYVKSDGKMAVSEWVDGGKYYVDAKGAWLKNFQYSSSGIWYKNADGTYPKNTWKQIDGKWYYFNASGYMLKNTWKGSYYLKSDGTMATSEWVDGGKYYVNSSGVWLQNWKYSTAGRWYRNADGTYPKSTWMKIDGGWYYFNASGYMKTSCWIGGTYYVKADGRMATSEWVDGGRYYVDANGVWDSTKTK